MAILSDNDSWWLSLEGGVGEDELGSEEAEGDDGCSCEEVGEDGSCGCEGVVVLAIADTN